MYTAIVNVVEALPDSEAKVSSLVKDTLRMNSIFQLLYLLD